MRLMQHGAESKFVEQTLMRLGIALGLDSVEVGITANALLVTGIVNQCCVTSSRRFYDRGINMYVVSEIQRVTIRVEKKQLNLAQSIKLMRQIKPLKYNRYLVMVMIGLSCASLSRLFGGDSWVFVLTFIASTSAMFVRQSLAHRHHNPFLIFMISAFVATTIASIGVRFQLGNQPELIMAASVLLLVPGFPLINAVFDMVKGYVINGMTRWIIASLLTISAAAGIALSMTITGIQGWL
ncbi:threonine/serine exporter family protein [Thalassotalea sp. LPB0316]|nr:threonine/serine exporter family protein [Thalassotalea sp. LPB0316]